MSDEPAAVPTPTPALTPVVPSVEERLAEVERKVDFVYNYLSDQAAAAMAPVLQEQLAASLKEQLMRGVAPNGAANA